MKWHQCFAFCLCGLIIGAALTFAVIQAGRYIGLGLKYNADAEVETARINHMTAREYVKANEQRSIAAYMELEAKRTDLEGANRKVVQAEYRLQAVCKRSKVRC
jgi:hypothetical protein